MASTLPKLPPPLINGGRQTPVVNFQTVTLSAASASSSRGRQVRKSISTKATGDSSGGSSTSLSIVESVKNFSGYSEIVDHCVWCFCLILPIDVVWDVRENRYAVFGLGFTAVIALHSALTFIAVIDKLPFFPTLLQVIGVLYSFWFVSRYLLYKPTREELYDNFKKYTKDIF